MNQKYETYVFKMLKNMLNFNKLLITYLLPTLTCKQKRQIFNLTVNKNDGFVIFC